MQPHWLTRLLLSGGWARTLRWLLLVLAAAVAQGVWANSLRLGPATPDFPLIVLACLALLTNPNTAAWAGFLTGLLHASMLEQTVGSLIISRTLAATAVAYLPMVLSKRHGLSIVPTVALLTLLAQGLLYLAAPSVSGSAFWQATLWGMVYNIGLAIPACWLIRRIVPPELDDEAILWNN
ncbi:MAG: rod shape-determining protein MreD [Fimbriimonadales bacterium]|nr:rod shape-determining protein MreD [Fimbriimonadales bacterium]